MRCVQKWKRWAQQAFLGCVKWKEEGKGASDGETLGPCARLDAPLPSGSLPYLRLITAEVGNDFITETIHVTEIH